MLLEYPVKCSAKFQDGVQLSLKRTSYFNTPKKDILEKESHYSKPLQM